MNDKNKTKDQLIDELTELRKRITGLKKCETERWKAEEALGKCEEKYFKVVELSPAVILIVNLKGIITSCSHVIKNVIGYSKEEIIGKHFTKLPFFRTKDIPQYIKIFTSLLKGKVPEPFKIEVIHKEGTFRYIEICVGLLKKDGKKTGIQIVGLDVTAHKMCEKVQSSLYRISESTFSTENFDELYRSIHNTITDLIPASSNFYIALYDKDFETVDFPYVVDEFIENTESQRLIKELIAYILRSGKPLLASPEVFDELRNKGEITSAGPLSINWLGVPLKTGDKMIGAMAILNYTENIRYIEKDKKILSFISEQVAMVIQHRQAEEILQKSRDRLLKAQYVAKMGFLDWNLKTNEIFWSEEVYLIYGINPKEIKSNIDLTMQLVHPDDLEFVQKNLDLAVKGVKNYDIDHRILRPDGKVIWIHAQAEFVRDAEGRPESLLGTIVDITERKKGQEALRESEELFRASVDTMLDGFAFFSAIRNSAGNIVDFRYEYMNEAGCKLNQMSFEEQIGHTLLELLPAHKETGLFDEYVQVVETGESLAKTSFVYDDVYGKSRRMIRAFDFQAVKLFDGFAVTWRDISEHKKTEEELHRAHTELERRVEERTVQLSESNKSLKKEIHEHKRTEEELHKAKKGAEVANRTKSDFLACMSHELRTPLNTIIGFSEVLIDHYFGKLNKKQSEYINDILESGRHLLTLINDVLDLSKIESGKMEIDLSKENIKNLLESCLVMLKEKYLRHGISLDILIPKKLKKVEFITDKRKFKQIMFNFLSNAAKFTPDGGSITLVAQHLLLVNGHLHTQDGQIISLPVTDDQELMTHRNYLEISVEDTGIGISPEHQERIFEKFYQVKDNLRNTGVGTGLGLSLAKHLVEELEGRIRVESEGEGKGSRFSFVLPLKSMNLL